MSRPCLFLVFLLFAVACNRGRSAGEKEIVASVNTLNDRIPGGITAVLVYADEHRGLIDDSLKLAHPHLVKEKYDADAYRNFWSDNGSILRPALQLREYLKQCRYDGLFPGQYHAFAIDTLCEKLQTDSSMMLDVLAWTKLDLLLTDAFIGVARDLKEGRLVADSVSLYRKPEFFKGQFDVLQKSGDLDSLLAGLQPQTPEYQDLRASARSFVSKMDDRPYTVLSYPYKDTAVFFHSLTLRLREEGLLQTVDTNPDSATLAQAVLDYQKKKGLVEDGIAGPAVVRSLNFTDAQKFLQYAITLDKYKRQQPFPEEFLLVNIPSYYLQVIHNGSVVLRSKVIIGRPATPTPEITSAINNMVVYPRWVVPASIIRKEILPQLKVNPGYLFAKGFHLEDEAGQVVDPYAVDWSKYTKWIPWKVVQGSGNENALGVFKFNFPNDHSVYLHDTNQPYLFASANRALSHGCVRVENWRELAAIIASRDAELAGENQDTGYSADSITTWVGEQRKKSIYVKHRFPLFIRYYTCAVEAGDLQFYPDIYGIDKKLAEKYF